MTKQNTETPEIQPEQKPAPQIPDKFKNKSGDLNADALIKSYLELEKKMASRTPIDPIDSCPDKPEDYEIKTKRSFPSFKICRILLKWIKIYRN